MILYATCTQPMLRNIRNRYEEEIHTWLDQPLLLQLLSHFPLDQMPDKQQSQFTKEVTY